MEKYFNQIISNKDVQELLKKGVKKDSRVRCSINDINYLTVSCDMDLVEIGYVGKDFDVKKMNKMLHEQQLKM